MSESDELEHVRYDTSDNQNLFSYETTQWEQCTLHCDLYGALQAKADTQAEVMAFSLLFWLG